MSFNCVPRFCCEEDAQYFKTLCEDSARIDSTIPALAIIENDDIPAIGDTVTITTSLTPVVITACNEIETLLQWVKDRLFACEGGGNYYTLLSHKTIKKGTKAKPTMTFNEQPGNYFSDTRKFYEAISDYDLGQLLVPNIEFFDLMLRRESSFSLIQFTNRGGFVLRAGDGYTITMTDAGFEIVGDKNEYIAGSIQFKEKGTKQAGMSVASNATTFLRELKKEVKFTFETTVVTGASAAACGSIGGCEAFTVIEDTLFTIDSPVAELVSCGTYSLYENCFDALSVELAALIEVDPVTGIITAAAGLPVGEYKFTKEVVNACNVAGSICYKIIVTAA